MKRASEMLESVLCDPDGRVLINGSTEDKEIIRAAIDMVIKLEQWKDRAIQIGF